MKWYNRHLHLVAVAQVVLLTLFLLSGCRTSQVGTKETQIHNKVDSTSRRSAEEVMKLDSMLKRDSVWLHDSIFIRQVGDTLYKERWHTKEVYKYLGRTNEVNHFKRDTVYKYVATGDTVYLDKKVEVEKKLSLWQKLKLECGGYLLVALVVAVCIILAKEEKEKNRS